MTERPRHSGSLSFESCAAYIAARWEVHGEADARRTADAFHRNLCWDAKALIEAAEAMVEAKP